MTSLAMLTSVLPGWNVECVDDDITCMKFSRDGWFYAITPKTGSFDVA